MTRVLVPTKQAFYPLSCLPSTNSAVFFSFSLSHLFFPFLKNNCAHIKFLLSALSVTFMLIHDFFILFHLIFSKLFMVPCGCFLLCNPFFFYITSSGGCFFSVSSINLAQLGEQGPPVTKKTNENLSGDCLHHCEWLEAEPMVWGLWRNMREINVRL